MLLRMLFLTRSSQVLPSPPRATVLLLQGQEELAFHNAVLRPNPKTEEYSHTMLL